MLPLNSEMGAASFRTKLALFILILALAFVVLDMWPLMALYNQIKHTHLQEARLNQVRQLLFSLYILKILWLLALSGIAVGFGYWIIKPYKAENTK